MIKASYTVMLISAITIVGPIIGIEATDSRQGALNSRRLYKQGVSRGKSFTLSPTEAHPKSRAPATVETDMPTYDFPSRSPTLSFDMWLLSSGPTSEPPFYTNLPTKTPSAEPQIDQMITSAPFAGSPTPKPTCNYSDSSSANTNYFSKASKAPSSLAVSPAGAGSRKPTKLAKTTKVPVVHTTTSDKPSTTPSEVNDVDQSLTESPSTSPSDINTIIIPSSAPSILVKDGPASSAPSKHPVTLHPSKAPSTTSPTPSCKSTKWHPNIGFHVCSNRLDDYLASWATPEMRENYFHNSLEECCNAVFGTSACEYQDICVSPSPTVSPSLPEPTQVPSKSPSHEPTSSPTLSPINPTMTPSKNPTPSPSVHPSSQPSSVPSLPFVDTLPPTSFNDSTTPTYSPSQPILPIVPEPTPSPIADIIDLNPTTTCVCTSTPTEAPTTGFPTTPPKISLFSPGPSSEPPYYTTLPTKAPVSTDFLATPSPSFGSTPTVSKETTGPPTMPAKRYIINMIKQLGSNDFKHLVYTSRSETECSPTIIRGRTATFCKLDCIETARLFEGDTMIRETYESYVTDCNDEDEDIISPRNIVFDATEKDGDIVDVVDGKDGYIRYGSN
eukprot:g14261.t1 g14261   contig9:1490089-1492276(+)